jgi:hypothetical protein
MIIEFKDKKKPDAQWIEVKPVISWKKSFFDFFIVRLDGEVFNHWTERFQDMFDKEMIHRVLKGDKDTLSMQAIKPDGLPTTVIHDVREDPMLIKKFSLRLNEGK